MNLVAKEFVASRTDGDGVLILSSFAGAARELNSAVLVNPFSPSDIATAVFRAITMPAGERRRRMADMRETVAVNNVYRWGSDIIQALCSIGLAAEAETAPARVRTLSTEVAACAR